jgi:hypothetical protein
MESRLGPSAVTVLTLASSKWETAIVGRMLTRDHADGRCGSPAVSTMLSA